MMSDRDWEKEARTRVCPLCHSLPEKPCTTPSGKKRRISHAVRGLHTRGIRVL
jgi:hypothetical protein